ncbi:MAG: carboxypeptidase-like regulatory domain-containing protein [Acidobacteriota bacterium]
MRLALFALFATGLATAQTPATFEIRGTVTEPGGGGIAEVTIGAIAIDEPPPRTTLTGSRGEFRLTVEHPGLFFISVNKEGYFVVASPGNPGGAAVTLSSSNPQATVNIQLARGGEVGGRVLDPDTRAPIAGVEVFLFTRSWNYGRVQMARSMSGPPASIRPVITDRDGRFLFSQQRPGEYLAGARAPVPAAQRVIRNFSKTDIDVVDEVYAETYWPGEASAETASPLPLTYGGYADVGTIFLRKTKQYRALVSLDASCAPGELVKLSILKANASPVDLDTYPCGSQVLLRGFDPGAYAIYAVSRYQGNRPDMENAVWGSAPFAIADKNASVAVLLQHGIVIQGEVKLSEGARALLSDPVVSTRPTDVLAGAQPDRETFVRWGNDHEFVLATSLHAQSLSVQTLSMAGSSAYVKEVRFNGAPLRELILLPTSTPGKLEIIVDDKRSSVAGTVTDGSRSIAGAYVLAVRENTPPEANPFMLSTATGGFNSGSLTPGDYRIFAVAAEQRDRIHEPGVLDRVLSSAQKFTLAPGASQVLTVRISDAR